MLASAISSSETQAYFSDEPAGPPIVFQHIQKTARSSFRQFVHVNLEGSEIVLLPERKPFGRRADLLRLYREFYDSLEPERKRRLRCVMSHTAGFLLPALDGEACGITLIRDPVDRVLSRYYFSVRPTSLAKRPGLRVPPLQEQFEKWADHVPASDEKDLPVSAGLFNWQSRTLLAPWYDVSVLPYSREPPPDADVWRAGLFDVVERHYMVGTQERYQKFVAAVSKRFGWEPSIHKLKVNTQRPEPSEEEAALSEMIRAYNWLDAELYARYSSAMSASTVSS